MNVKSETIGCRCFLQKILLIQDKKNEQSMPTKVTHNPRRVLPRTRRSLTHKFAVAGHEGYLTIGLHEDGTPGEIFIKMSKEGSTLSGLIQGFCRAFSIALQYGLPLQDAVDRFRGMRFDPMGATNNPDIPEASSILDYVARFLELKFIIEVAQARQNQNLPN